ncbi:MAG TPA: competence/damage-inducible protein A [Candidatus Sulfotelmatobacter sp.]|jgi:nicotinamide-nucleotide amidase|nr:competence/damage-inducible protein A [Candidatus Sulfotelmatobacter sp.]
MSSAVFIFPFSFKLLGTVNAEIIAVGSELLTPFRMDTNSLYLTEQLNLLGVDVIFKSIVGDDLGRLVAAAQHGLFRSEILIFSGGLGPTEDDLTREAVAEALGLKLHRDPELLTRLEQRFAERGWKMASNNAKQADVLEGATVLANPNGTAPGQWLSGQFDGRERIIVLLPGPPFELKALFEAEVRERMRAKIPPAFLAVRTLKIAMLGESQVDARVSPIYKRYTDVDTTILAGAGEIELHFKSRATTPDAAQRRVDEVAGLAEDELDDAVYSRNGESLEQIVGYWLQMRNATLAVAESCTGGLLAERITSVGGSSRYFLGGAVVYSNNLKTELAGVPAEMIDRHGAVSREVAAALAEGIRYRCESTLGVGITGVAGPSGGTPDKPVGLVFHGVASSTGTEVIQRNFPGDRKRIRRFASTMALDMVRKKLM